jgi:16S rRNA (uracil1498-N3)-methyltransferase
VVERRRLPSMITLFAENVAGVGEYDLGEEAAHHAVVRRLVPGDPVIVVDGRGGHRSGRVASATKKTLWVSIDQIRDEAPPAAIHLFVPVADKDRTLWLAEKSVELQVASWTAVMYARSRSVTPRAEGAGFAARLRSRMIAALEQSGSSWLPQIRDAIEPSEMRSAGNSAAIILDRAGTSLAGHPSLAPGVSIAVGPEGGFETSERSLLQEAGWRPASIGITTLRFETAAIASLAIARASLSR